MSQQENLKPRETEKGSLNALEFLMSRGRHLVPTVQSSTQRKTETFSEPEGKALCRLSDPQTSKRAAEKVGKFVGIHKSKVWAALKDFGPMNYKEIALKAGLQPVQVGRVLHKMTHLIKPVGEREGCQVFEVI